MSKPEVGVSLISTIAKAGANDLLTDAAEFTLDKMLDENFVKDLPVFGTLAKFYKVGVSVRDYLFSRKLALFLSKLSDVPQEERERFGRRMDEEQAFRRQVGDHVVLILDRLDDVLKAELVGRAFRAFIRTEIDFETLQRFCAAIDRCLVADLKRLVTLAGGGAPLHVLQSLSAVGLVEINAVPYGGGMGPESYSITSLGSAFDRIVLALP